MFFPRTPAPVQTTSEYFDVIDSDGQEFQYPKEENALKQVLLQDGLHRQGRVWHFIATYQHALTTHYSKIYWNDILRNLNSEWNGLGINIAAIRIALDLCGIEPSALQANAATQVNAPIEPTSLFADLAVEESSSSGLSI